jgi:chloramphenicol-sensitive protein RarD
MSSHSHGSARGAAAAATGFFLWGALPVYWKQMEHINPVELISHRLVWSLAFVAAVLALRHGFAPVRAALANRRLIATCAASGGLLTVNWLTFLWAVDHGHIIESSLGYFLVPQFNVAFGFLVLRERLRPLPWLAIGCAAAGVVILMSGLSHLPWIALTLAGSWGLYGVLRKHSPLGSLDGLMVETLLYSPFAAAFLLWRQHTGEGALGHADIRMHLLVLSTGWVTALPLICFAYGARLIRLTTLGLLQYLTPTLHFLIGLLVYREAFDSVRFRACLFIWCGVIIYSVDGFLAQRRSAPAAA